MAINSLIVVRIKYRPTAVSASPASIGSKFSGAAKPQPTVGGLLARIRAGITPATITGMAMARACLNIGLPLVAGVSRYLTELIIHRDAAFVGKAHIVIRAFRCPRQSQNRVAALDQPACCGMQDF